MNILGCKNPPTCNPRCNYELLAELRNLLVQTIKQVTNGHSIYFHTAHHLLCPFDSFQAFFEIPHGILIFRAFTGHAEPSATYFLPVLITFSHRAPTSVLFNLLFEYTARYTLYTVQTKPLADYSYSKDIIITSFTQLTGTAWRLQ